jgi:hypothetical protein
MNFTSQKVKKNRVNSGKRGVANKSSISRISEVSLTAKGKWKLQQERQVVCYATPAQRTSEQRLSFEIPYGKG